MASLRRCWRPVSSSGAILPVDGPGVQRIGPALRCSQRWPSGGNVVAARRRRSAGRIVGATGGGVQGGSSGPRAGWGVQRRPGGLAQPAGFQKMAAQHSGVNPSIANDAKSRAGVGGASTPGRQWIGDMAALHNRQRPRCFGSPGGRPDGQWRPQQRRSRGGGQAGQRPIQPRERFRYSPGVWPVCRRKTVVMCCR